MFILEDYLRTDGQVRDGGIISLLSGMIRTLWFDHSQIGLGHQW